MTIPIFRVRSKGVERCSKAATKACSYFTFSQLNILVLSCFAGLTTSMTAAD